MDIYIIFMVSSVLAALVMGLIGAVEARRLVNKHKGVRVEDLTRKAPYIYAPAALSVLIIAFEAAVTVDKTLLLRIPPRIEPYATTALFTVLTGIASFLFSLAGAAALKSSHPKAKSLIISAVLAIVTIPLIQWQLTRPIYESLGDYVSHNGAVIQTSGVSCVAASGANVARMLGISATEREMARLMGTRINGTSFGQAVRGLEKIGIRCEVLGKRGRKLTALRPPSILFVDNPSTGPESHAVVFAGMSGQSAEILDPLEGRLYLTAGFMDGIWHGLGLSCSKGTDSP